MITLKRLTLTDVFEDCQNKFCNNKNDFFQLLDKTLDLDEFLDFALIYGFELIYRL